MPLETQLRNGSFGPVQLRSRPQIHGARRCCSEATRRRRKTLSECQSSSSCPRSSAHLLVGVEQVSQPAHKSSISSDRAPLAAWTVMAIKLSQGSCVKRPVLGGLHHEYRVEEIAQHNPIPQEERS